MMDAVKIGELYRKFGPVIYRRCVRLLGDPELSGDACQEVFVRAVRHADRLVSDRECLPWLYRVTTNYCLNLIRDKEKTAWLPLSAALGAGEESGVERTAAAQEEVRLLLDGFSDIDAQIALFAFLDRMTQSEIAEVTGLSRKTVGKRLQRIMKSARQTRQHLETEVAS